MWLSDPLAGLLSYIGTVQHSPANALSFWLNCWLKWTIKIYHHIVFEYNWLKWTIKIYQHIVFEFNWLKWTIKIYNHIVFEFNWLKWTIKIYQHIVFESNWNWNTDGSLVNQWVCVQKYDFTRPIFVTGSYRRSLFISSLRKSTRRDNTWRTSAGVRRHVSGAELGPQ